MTPPELSAQVECGKGFKADTGTLTLSGGQLRFSTAQGVAFDLPLAAIDKIVWHWYSFSAAFEATVAGKSYFLSFMPRGAGASTRFEALATARSWRAAIEGRALPTGPSLPFKILMLAFWFLRLFLMTFSLLFALMTATDSSAGNSYRILGGIMALLLVIYIVLFIILGVQSFRTPRKK